MNLPEVIRDCQNNRAHAFKKLFLMMSPYLMTTAKRYLDHQNAEDILQDSFILIFKSIHRIKPDKIGKGEYFHRIVINNCLKFLKKQQKFSGSLVQLSEQHQIGEWDISSLDAEDILKILDTLSGIPKLVFNLYEIDGYSHKEIGSQLGIAESTSRAHLARAKAKLQSQMHHYLNYQKS